jgi:4-hydroxy-tetrahydrodipicolinate synthase
LVVKRPSRNFLEHVVTSHLGGVIAAIPTPFDEGGEPDAALFVNFARHLLEHGCDGLNILGTTGEATSLTVAQRMGLMTAAAAALPLDQLMVGTGAAAVGDAVALTRHAEALGFAGALLLPPFYYKGIAAAGVEDYLRRVVEATTGIPLYLYNFPALSGVAYSVVLVDRIRTAFPDRIAGLKDSSGDLTYARAVAALSPSLAVFPSNEAALLGARSGEFAGCISATANLNADLCARAYRNGDERALAQAVAIRGLFDGVPLLPGVKAVLAHLHNSPAIARVLPPLEATNLEQTRLLVDGHSQIRGGNEVRGA